MARANHPGNKGLSKNKFGFILCKIKLPGKVQGVGLSIETFSMFPKEQEIIIPPYTKLKLIGKDTDFNYYHIDDNFKSKIIKKYEFELIEIEKKLKIKSKFQSIS